MNKIILSLFFFIFSNKGYPQQQQIDSLEKVVRLERSDIKKVPLINQLARIYLDKSDTVAAVNLLNQSLALSGKTKDNYGTGFTFSTLGVYHLRTGDYEKADSLFQLAYSYYIKENSELCRWGAAAALGEMATTLSRKGDYEKAIQYKLKAIEIYGNATHPDIFLAKANLYGGIASLYADHGQYDKAIYYDKKGIEASSANNYSTVDLGLFYINLADDFTRTEQTDSAKKYLEVVKNMADSLVNPILYSKYYNYYAKIHLKEKNYDQSLVYGLKALEYAQSTKSVMSLLIAHLTIARSYNALGKHDKALAFLEKELEIAEKIKSDRERKIVLLELANTARALNKSNEAYSYLNQYALLNDSLQKKGEKIKLNEIETKYQSEKKQLQIVQLEKEKQIQDLTIKQKTNWLYVLIGGLVAVTLIVILYHKSNRRKHQLSLQVNTLQQQKIKELEQEKQLLAVNSILQGQEAERTRMAKDLHDGLGGILSGIKLNLSSMKGNLIINERDATLFSKSITQLDNAIAEMRRVAHNMMPEALLKFGLSEAIQDYCDGINESNIVKLKYTQLGLAQPLERPVEVVLYRIIQELTNNVIKHAEAKIILIQLSKHERGITLTVEDDGKGFNVKQIENNKGTGLQNVQSRVDYLKGNLEIQSTSGNGTSVTIEIPV
ncbi:MAG: sensor histidine kinase [Bacteroidota bacterium]